MAITKTFLVTGATGSQGGATARHLLEAGAKVHALVRNLSSPAAIALASAGAVLFPGDFDDISGIEAAIKGVDGLFLNPQISHDDPNAQARHGKIFVAAAQAAQVHSIVVSTAFWTGNREHYDAAPEVLKWYYTEKLAVEQAVKEGGFESWTFLRPAWLFYNYLLPSSKLHFPELAKEGVLKHVYDEGTKMPQFDGGDVGKFAAAALLDPEKFKHAEIELGYEHLTIGEVGKILAEVSGKVIKVQKRTEEEEKESAGLVPTQIFQIFARERDLSIPSGLEEKWGIKLKTLREYMEENKEELVRTLSGEA